MTDNIILQAGQDRTSKYISFGIKSILASSVNYPTYLEKATGIATGIYLNESDIRDWEWSVSSSGMSLTLEEPDYITKTLPFVICAEDTATANKLKNDLYELIRENQRAWEEEGQYGRLIVGYHDEDGESKYANTNTCMLDCRISGIKFANYLKNQRMLTGDITIVTDHPKWYWSTREIASLYNGDTLSGLDYPFDYAYDYSINASAKTGKIYNKNDVPSDFLMTMTFRMTEGTATASDGYPTIKIGANIYQLDVNLKDMLVNYGSVEISIDSRNHTITAEANGHQNWYKYRNRTNYIFEKIPSGESEILYLGDLDASIDLSIVLYNERMIPEWM